MKRAISNGAEGIGVLRTEFLYGSSDSHSEEYHFQNYREAIKLADNRPITIRTYCGGAGDPLMGQWGIRHSMANEEQFITQIRAILRASAYAHGNNVNIVLPGIADIEEFKWAKDKITTVKNQLKDENQEISGYVPLGIMIEIPAVVLSLEMFTHEVNFYLVDSDKLLQYIMAIDTRAPAAPTLNDPMHPAMLRTLKRIVECKPGQKLNISICGRLAEIECAIPLFIGLAIRSIAIDPSLIAKLFNYMNGIDKESSVRIAAKALALSNSDRIKNYVHAAIDKLR